MKFVITIEAPDGSTVHVDNGQSIATGNQPAVRSNAAPSCPKHGAEKVRESKFGGWYCSAPDDDEPKGYCAWKQK